MAGGVEHRHETLTEGRALPREAAVQPSTRSLDGL